MDLQGRALRSRCLPFFEGVHVQDVSMEPVWVWAGEEFMVGVVFGMRHLLFSGCREHSSSSAPGPAYTVHLGSVRYTAQCTVYSVHLGSENSVTLPVILFCYYFIIFSQLKDHGG